MSEAVDDAPGTATAGPRRGARIEVDGIGRTVGDGHTLLAGVSFALEPGELVAIVGGSGAGKTTLLEAVAGVRPPDVGSVRFDGVDVRQHLDWVRSILGFVPQDDIIHLELPLRDTLEYAAALRLPVSTTSAELRARVDAALDQLGLTDRADVPVSTLSGGQRKRASIAVELLTDPRVCFLDEPTSGLDPATSAGLLVVLRELADAGSTVVLTTHAIQDLRHCDRVLFLAPGGRLAFAGTVDEALDHFGVDSVEAVYVLLAGDRSPDEWAERFRERTAARAADEQAAPAPDVPGAAVPAPRPGRYRQWRVLTRRTAHALVRNRLTLAILLGSPVMVVAMFAVLFQAGAFDPADPSPSATIMIVFWVAFGGFFFGLTYGLLQVCTEVAILRRERLVGLDLGAYLLSKLAVLLPFLAAVAVVMLAVLRALDRLPAADLPTYASIAVTLLLDAVAGLTLGLLASAAVANPSQATLALPMLCFPAVLFSGAILPVAVMAPVGEAIALVVPDRWAFEAIGHDLGMRELFATGASPLGPPLLAAYGDAGSYATTTYWLILAAFSVVFLAAAWIVLARRSASAMR